MALDNLQPMDFGEIFSSTISLLRRTLLPAALFALLLLAGIGVMKGYANMIYIDRSLAAAASVGNIDLKTDTEAAQKFGVAMLNGSLLLFGATALQVIVVAIALVIGTLAAWRGISREDPSLGAILGRALRRFWPLILQGILVMIVLAAIFVPLILLCKGAGDPNPAITASIIALLPVAALFTLLATTIQKVAIEDRGPWQGMIASITLVKKHWLRTLGALVLFGVVYWALSLLMTQLITGHVAGMLGGNTGDESGTDIATMVVGLKQAKEMLTPAYVIAQALLDAVALLLLAYLTTVLYIDLRARANDFYDDDEATTESGGPDLLA